MPAPTLNSQRLNVLQSFRETTWGTPGAATARWMALSGVAEFTPFRKATAFKEFRGTLAPAYLFSQLKRGGTWKIMGRLTYEDVIFLGHAFWATVTPTGTNPYTYTYTGPLGTQPTLTTFTFEYNQAGLQTQAVGCVATKLTLKGEAEKEWTYELSGFAQDIDSAWSGSLAVLSDRTVEVATFPQTALWMDAFGTAIGTTAFSARLLKAQFDFENGARPIPTGGTLLPAGWVIGEEWKTSASLQILAASDTKTYINSTLQSPNGALLRVRPVSGTKQITWDYAGILADDIKQIGEFQGAQAWDFKLDGMYGAAAALHTNMTVINAVSTIP